MPKSAGPLERLEVDDRQAWRAWLEQNHARSPGVHLVIYKKHSSKYRLSYDEIVEEALCFGWIDSTGNRLDGERYILRMSPRKPGSVWAPSNKQRVARLIRQGLMTPAGLAKIKAAKRDGSWDRYDAVEALAMPPDLKKALAANKAAQKNFTAFSDSAKKMILWWIAGAKRPETRTRRIQETVRLAAENRKAPG